MTIVISAFPGTGKTFLFNNFEMVMLDSDSSKFSHTSDGIAPNPDFPLNYVEHIRSQIGKTDLIMVSTHKVVREALTKAKIPFSLIFPERENKEEYLGRYRMRGSPTGLIEILDKNWDTFLDELEGQKCFKKIRLGAGMFLSDVLFERCPECQMADRDPYFYEKKLPEDIIDPPNFHPCGHGATCGKNNHPDFIILEK